MFTLICSFKLKENQVLEIYIYFTFRYNSNGTLYIQFDTMHLYESDEVVR